MKILIFDNYDSFTYNLVHLVEKILHIPVEVFRNDEITLDQGGIYDRIIISPGPGLPSESGITSEIIRHYFSSKPILGVCLGMQAIAEVCGAKLFNIEKVFHGVSEKTIITDSNEKLFNGISSPFNAGRYHSWGVDKSTLPASLKVTAVDQFGNIMALTHENQLMRGVQFHPESILTEFGNVLMKNWLFHC